MVPARAWALLLLLTLLNVLNFADRHMLVGFANSVIADLGLSHLQFTLLSGLFFTACYTLAGMFMGVLADRWHRPRLIGAGLALWSSFTLLTGLVDSFAGIAAARAMVGVGAAALTPAALAMLADRFPVTRTGFVSGFYYLGIPVGVGGSFLLASLLGPTLGWRGAFLLLGGVGLALAPVLLLLPDVPRRRAAPVEVEPAAPPVETARPGFLASFGELWQAIRAERALLLTYLGTILVLLTQGAAMLDPVWLHEERGYTVGEAQQLLGICFLVAGIAGALFGGVASDWCHRRFAGGRMKFLAGVFLLVVPAGLGYRLLPPDNPLFLVSLLIVSASIMVPFGPVSANVQALTPPQLRSTAMAFLILCMAFLGYAPGAALTGALSDAFQALGVAEPLTWALTLSIVPGVLAVPVFWFAASGRAAA